MKIETFEKVIKVRVASNLINDVDDYISLRLEDTTSMFDAILDDWVIASLVHLDIDPQIVNKQMSEIRKLKHENKELKKKLNDQHLAIKEVATWKLEMIKDEVDELIDTIGEVDI